MEFFERNFWLVPIVTLVGSTVILFLDYVVGPYVEFPVLFLMPILFASWYGGMKWGLSFAVTLPLVRLYFSTVWDSPGTLLQSVVNAVIRIGIFVLITVLADLVASQTRALQLEVKNLEGLLPICSHCKKIKSEDGSWTVMERYISDHSQAEFTHGICPDCVQKYYPDIAKKMAEKI